MICGIFLDCEHPPQGTLCSRVARPKQDWHIKTTGKAVCSRTRRTSVSARRRRRVSAPSAGATQSPQLRGIPRSASCSEEFRGAQASDIALTQKRTNACVFATGPPGLCVDVIRSMLLMAGIPCRYAPIVVDSMRHGDFVCQRTHP